MERKHRCRRWFRGRVCKRRLVPACFSKCDGIGSPPAFPALARHSSGPGGENPCLWDSPAGGRLLSDQLLSDQLLPDRHSRPPMGDSPEPKPRGQQLLHPDPFSNVPRALSSDFLTPKVQPRDQAAVTYPEKVAGTGHVILYPLICQREKKRPSTKPQFGSGSGNLNTVLHNRGVRTPHLAPKACLPGPRNGSGTASGPGL